MNTPTKDTEAMNLTKTLIARLETSWNDGGKHWMKGYLKAEKAESVAEVLAKECALDLGSSKPARYLIVYVPSIGRHFPCFDMTELLRRENVGGYVGCFAPHFNY